MEKFDIVIIGAGPGGYTAAIRAAQLGKSVCIIEKGDVGGTCLNRGCIPTKTIHYCTKLYAKMKKASSFGINIDNLVADLSKMIDRKDRIVGQLRKGLEYLFRENKIDLIKGEGKIVDSKHVEVNGATIHAENIILATGSTIPDNPPIKIDEKKVFSSNGILDLRTIPSSIAIIGAGPIGVELSCIFNELGSKVALYEAMPRILPNEDEEISKTLGQLLSKKGIEIKVGMKFEDNSMYENVLVCVGRKLNTHGLEKIGIKLDKGKVIVNDRMQTSVAGIYAVGDIVGRYMFAHSASREGIVAAENIAGRKIQMDYSAVPRCTYSEPGVGSVGLTEQDARAKFGDVRTGKFPFSASSKSLIEDERDGFIKIVADRSGKVLGVHIVGSHATELIGEASLAVQNGLKVEDIIKTIHAHPTVHESMYEAAENVLKRSIAILNR